MASTQTQLREHNQVTGATAQVSALRLLQAGAAPRTGLIAPARPRHSAPACAARVAPAPPSWARPPASAAASWPARPASFLAVQWCQGATLLPAPSRRHGKPRLQAASGLSWLHRVCQ